MDYGLCYGAQSLPYQDYRIQDKGSTKFTDKGSDQNKGQHQDQNSGQDKTKDQGSDRAQELAPAPALAPAHALARARVHVVLEVRAIDPAKTNEHSRARHIANHRALRHSIEVRQANPLHPSDCLFVSLSLSIYLSIYLTCYLPLYLNVCQSRLPDVRVTSQDFALLPYREQVALAHSAGVFVSMHGAGTDPITPPLLTPFSTNITILGTSTRCVCVHAWSGHCSCHVPCSHRFPQLLCSSGVTAREQTRIPTHQGIHESGTVVRTTLLSLPVQGWVDGCQRNFRRYRQRHRPCETGGGSGANTAYLST